MRGCRGAHRATLFCAPVPGLAAEGGYLAFATASCAAPELEARATVEAKATVAARGSRSSEKMRETKEKEEKAHWI